MSGLPWFGSFWFIYGFVTVCTWNGPSGSGFLFRRFLWRKGCSVFPFGFFREGTVLVPGFSSWKRFQWFWFCFWFLKKGSSGSGSAFPCPSFPWSFRKHQGELRKHQGVFWPCEPFKTLANEQKTPQKTKEIPSKKNTKETQRPRKRRTGLVPEKRFSRFQFPVLVWFVGRPVWICFSTLPPILNIFSNFRAQHQSGIC